MKKIMLAAVLSCLAGSVLAAGKPCEELKAEIDAKIKAKGATGYTLEVVEKGAGGGKVVGTCQAGSKEIIYRRS